MQPARSDRPASAESVRTLNSSTPPSPAALSPATAADRAGRQRSARSTAATKSTASLHDISEGVGDWGPERFLNGSALL